MSAASPQPVPLEAPANRPAGAVARLSASEAVFWLVCFAVALWDLNGRSIYHRDLPRFATIAREMIRSGDWLVPTQYGETYANKPILYVWAVAFPSWLAGDVSALWTRFPNALALVATAVATSAWAARRTGSRDVGHAAGLIVLTTMFVNELGRVGRPDGFATAFSTIAAAAIDVAILSGASLRALTLTGLALGAGLLSKGPVAWLVPAAVLLVPRAGVSLRERLHRTRPLLLLGVAIAFAAAWVLPVTLRDGFGFLGRLGSQVSERVGGRGNHQEGPFHYLVEFPLSALPWTPLYLAAAVVAATRRGRAALHDGALVGAVGAALLVLSAIPTKEIRYASILVPPLAVAAAHLAASQLERLRARGMGRSHLATLGGVAVLLGVGALVVLALVPAAMPWGAPPAALVVAGGVAALVASRRREEAALAPGRIAALVLLLACAASCVYWSVFARYLGEDKGERENRAVLAVLEPAVPAVLLGGKDVPGEMTPDDLFDVVGRGDFVRSLDRLPTPAAAPRLLVVTLAEQAEGAARARGETPREVLRRPRGDRHTLVVLRFGPP